MSANIAHIDLNSDLLLGDREFDGHGDVSVTEAVRLNQRGQVKNSSTDHVRNLCPADASAGALFEFGANGEPVRNGLKRTRGFDESFSHRELEIRPAFRTAPPSTVDDDSSMQRTITFDRDKEGDVEGEPVSWKSPGVDADSITDDENGLVWRLSCGSLDSIHADPLSCREAKRQKVDPSEGVTEVEALNGVDQFSPVEEVGNIDSLLHLQNREQFRMKKALDEGFSFSICVDRKSEDTRSSERFDCMGSLNSSLGCPQAPEEVSESTDLPVQDPNLIATDSSHYETMIVDQGKLTNETLALNLFNMVVDLNPCVVRNEKTLCDENEKSSVFTSEFQGSDLVWGKVRSHPWWPGQILDPSASSKKAEKYFKKGSYLIAYFGDQTFAWNEVSLIKPFQEHFSQLEKQSTFERFHHAIDCALEEVSRRVEFGLACHCLSSELYSNLQNQVIANPGSREGSIRRDNGDRYWGAASFNPRKLLSFIKSVVKFPHDEADRLELEIVRAQTLSFNRWKGYSQLPEFRDLGGLLENGEELLDEKLCRETTEDAGREVTGDKHGLSEKRKKKNEDSTCSKRRYRSGNNVYVSKTEETSSDLGDEKLFHRPNGENKALEETDGRLISISSGKEAKRSDSVAEDRVTDKKDHLPVASPEKNAKRNQVFRVGDSIQRVASKLNGPNPILMRNDGLSYKAVDKNKERSHNGKPVDSESHSVDEVLSQLCSAATKPTKGNESLLAMLSFLTDFRNSVLRITSLRNQATGGYTKIRSSEFEKGTVKSGAEESE